MKRRLIEVYNDGGSITVREDCNGIVLEFNEHIYLCLTNTEIDELIDAIETLRPQPQQKGKN